MSKWRVHYAGPHEIEVEADEQNEAEELAEGIMMRGNIRAELVCEEEKE